MKQLSQLKNWIIPGIIAIIFLFISFIYLFPVLEGKGLSATDGQMYSGMAKELDDYRNANGEEALWTNRTFGGMPSYLISTVYKGNIPAIVQNMARKIIPYPVDVIFFGFVFFFALGLIMKVKPWVSFAGALAYGFTTFTFVLIGTGHATKAHTLTYMALLVAGVLMTYRGKFLWGSLLTAFSLSWMINANHPQMTYYAGIMVLMIVIAYLVTAFREKELPKFFKASTLLLIAAFLAVSTNFGKLWTVYEYGKYSMRGTSELTVDEQNQTSGLNRDYILDYSYDLGEAMTAFIPRFKGGGMGEPLGQNSATFQLFEKYQGKQAAIRACERLPLYWGTQPISMSPFYYGAVLCFLFVLGLFLVRGPDKWWIVAVVVVSFLLSLGKNAPMLSNFMIDYFPGYNKFRDVKNIIVIQQFAMALLGLLAAKEIYLGNIEKKVLLKKLMYSWIIVGGLALVFVLIPGLAGNFSSPSDAHHDAQFVNALRIDRESILRSDAFRSFAFVSLAAGIIWLFVQKKIKPAYVIVAWTLLILVDLLPVNKKYLNSDNFTSKSKVVVPFSPSNADKEILDDPDPNFRVLNLAVGNPFSDGSTSYFHKSLGGYHGAKMKRYQEIIDYYISSEIHDIIKGFQNPMSLDSLIGQLTAINMLNTKYIIYNPAYAPIENYQINGHVWLADSIIVAKDANEEIQAIGDYDLKTKAVIHQSFHEKTKNIDLSGLYPESIIELIEYHPNSLSYKANIKNKNSLAVFSEIWYPEGWKAYIDGKEVDILRANYILRALVIPEGEHEITFSFEPTSYYVGNKVSLAGSLVLLIVLLAGLLIFIKKQRNEKSKED